MLKGFGIAAVSVAALGSSVNAALVAGDIAIIGRTNNGSPDAFTIVTLANIGAGETVYFTDNGWQTAGGFRGVTATDGDGNENATRITFANSVPAGTVISSTETGNVNYTWSISGTIGNNTATYQHISQGNGGEQLYAFQTTEIDEPYFVNGSMTHLFLFDDTNGFEDGTSSTTGNITPGLSVAAGTVAGINSAVAGTISFNTATLSSGYKSDWLTAIATPSNWTGTSLPSGSITVLPEPTAMGLLAITGLVALRRRR